MNENDIEIIDGDRFPITVDQLRELMGWSFGYEGELIAELWRAFNDRFWDGRLEPCPMFFPRSTTYGRWIGLFTASGALAAYLINPEYFQDRAGDLTEAGLKHLTEFVGEVAASAIRES